jgi:hypothetical protein
MTRAMMWSLVALVCLLSRPAAGGPQSACGIQIDKNSIGGVVVNGNGAKPEVCEFKPEISNLKFQIGLFGLPG